LTGDDLALNLGKLGKAGNFRLFPFPLAGTREDTMHPVRFLAGLAALVVLVVGAGPGRAQKKELNELKVEDFRPVIKRELEKERKKKGSILFEKAGHVFVLSDTLPDRMTYDPATGTLTVRVRLKPKAPAGDHAAATGALKDFVIGEAIRAKLVVSGQVDAGAFKVEIRPEAAGPPEKEPPPVAPPPEAEPPVKPKRPKAKELHKHRHEDFRLVIRRALARERKKPKSDLMINVSPIILLDEALVNRITYDPKTGKLTIHARIRGGRRPADIMRARKRLQDFIIHEVEEANLVDADQVDSGAFTVESTEEAEGPPEEEPPPPDKEPVSPKRERTTVPPEPEPEPLPVKPKARPPVVPPPRLPRREEKRGDEDEPPPPVLPRPKQERRDDEALPPADRRPARSTTPSAASPSTYYIPYYYYYPYWGCQGLSYYPVVYYYAVSYAPASSSTAAARGTRESEVAQGTGGAESSALVMAGRENGNGRPRARGDADTLFWRGYKLYWQRQYPAALESLSAAVDVRAGDARYWYYKALTERALGDEGAAVASLRQGAAWRSRNSPSLDVLLGSLERVQGPDRQFINSVRRP
jgi:outer membrane biosynthesis protein TonB